MASSNSQDRLLSNNDDKRITVTRTSELHRTLVIVGSIAALAIISLAGTGLYRLNSHNVLLAAEDDAIRICSTLSELEKPILFSPTTHGSYLPSIIPSEIPNLDKRLRLFLKPFDIVKIKIYSRDSQIIYSTDNRIIGETDSDNLRLQRALKGGIDSHLESKAEFRDLADEQMINVQVVETYIPIRDPNQKVIGAFEVYINVTKYHREIAKNVFYSVAIITVTLLSVFAFAYLLLRKAMIQLKEAQDRLEQLAITDPLTGIFNRRHILARSRQEHARIVRVAKAASDAPTMGFIMLDLDNFKMINDTYGHIAGDKAIETATTLIQGACRQYDLVGRYGGEEFLVALPDIEKEEIRKIAERIREAISLKPCTVDGNLLIPMTLSAGISCCLPGEEDIFPAIKRADEGLYLAKRSGRNQVRSVQDELAS